MEVRTSSPSIDPSPILLVDDAPLIRQHLRSFLAEATPGLRISEAGDVAEAEERFDALHPGVVVLDLGLRGGSGIDVLRHVRETKRSCTVVVLTNDREPETRQHCSELGADFVFTKSDEFELAVETVRRAAVGETPGGRAVPRIVRAMSSPVGLGDRPAVLLAKLAQEFDSEVRISRNGRTADARSYPSLLLLGIPDGEMVELSVVGSDAVEASWAIEALFAAGFREEPGSGPEPAGDTTERGGIGERSTGAPSGGRLRLRLAEAFARCGLSGEEGVPREVVEKVEALSGDGSDARGGK